MVFDTYNSILAMGKMLGGVGLLWICMEDDRITNTQCQGFLVRRATPSTYSKRKISVSSQQVVRKAVQLDIYTNTTHATKGTTDSTNS